MAGIIGDLLANSSLGNLIDNETKRRQKKEEIYRQFAQKQREIELEKELLKYKSDLSKKPAKNIEDEAYQRAKGEYRAKQEFGIPLFQDKESKTPEQIKAEAKARAEGTREGQGSDESEATKITKKLTEINEIINNPETDPAVRKQLMNQYFPEKKIEKTAEEMEFVIGDLNKSIDEIYNKINQNEQFNNDNINLVNSFEAKDEGTFSDDIYTAKYDPTEGRIVLFLNNKPLFTINPKYNSAMERLNNFIQSNSKSSQIKDVNTLLKSIERNKELNKMNDKILQSQLSEVTKLRTEKSALTYRADKLKVANDVEKSILTNSFKDRMDANKTKE